MMNSELTSCYGFSLSARCEQMVCLVSGPCGGSLRGGVQTRISWFKSKQGLHSFIIEFFGAHG